MYSFMESSLPSELIVEVFRYLPPEEIHQISSSHFGTQYAYDSYVWLQKWVGLQYIQFPVGIFVY